MSRDIYALFDRITTSDELCWKLFTATENALHPLFITDKKGTIEYANTAFLELSGYSEQEIIGQNPRILKSGHQSAEYYKNLWETISTGRVHQSELIDRKKNGELYYLEQTIAPIKDRSGEITHFVSYSYDVTERRRIQQELKSSENQFQRIVENAPDAVFIQTEQKFAYLNQRACELFKVKSADELIGKNVLDFVHPDSREHAKKRIQKLNVEEKSVPELLEVVFFNAAGEEMWVETAAEVINYKGEKGGLVFVRDISLRKNFESELANMELTSHAVLNSLSSAICVLDADLRLRSFNENFAKVIGIQCYSELKLGDSYTDFTQRTPGVSDELKQHIIFNLHQVADRKIPKFKLEFSSTIDQVTTWFLLGVFPLRTRSGGIVISLQDITDRKEAEIVSFESQQKFTHAFNEAPHGMAIVSLEGIYIDVNNAFARMIGYQKSEVVGLSAKDLTFEDDLPKIEKVFGPIIEKKKGTVYYDRVFKAKNGEPVYASGSATLVIDNQGEPEYFVAQLVDLTEKIKYIESLETQNNLLRDIAWIQSHKVRAPLARIMSLVAHLNEPETPEYTYTQAKEDLLRSSKELDEMIREIVSKASQIKT